MLHDNSSTIINEIGMAMKNTLKRSILNSRRNSEWYESQRHRVKDVSRIKPKADSVEQEAPHGQ